jgi:hydrogenase/urease accessory protein HupE
LEEIVLMSIRKIFAATFLVIGSLMMCYWPENYNIVVLDANTPIFNFITQFFYFGFTHVSVGLDHIVFLFGLYLISANLKSLVTQITAFTFAHFIILFFVISNITSLCSSFIEPIMALSVVFVFLESIFYESSTPCKWLVVFSFGLVHGLRLANSLLEFGLQSDRYVAAVVSFNIGIEFAQICMMIVIGAFVFGLMNVGWRSLGYRSV